TFFFSAVSEMFIKTPYKEEASHLGDDETEKASFSDAIAHIKSIKGFGSLLVSILFINFAVSPLFSVGIVYLFNNILVKPAMDLAITNVVFSASTLIAGIVIGAIKLKSSGATIRRFIALLTLGFILISINIALVMNGITSYPVFYILTLVLNLFMGVTIIFVNVPLNTGMTKVIAPSYRGRVFSLTGALSQIAMPVSLILSGFVIDNFGIVSLAGVCSFLAIIPTVVFIMNKNLRHLFEGIDHANSKDHPEPIATEAV
ncbi:MAG: hypothetical protein PHP32_07425, partial [Candidatus Izemoplasmatales bacterium]|nr:hypothetical protein [Candidatus Izemoplasmatales bacterium]